MTDDALSLDEATAEVVVEYLRGRCFPDAKKIRLHSGFGIQVSPGRMVIIDPDDWHSNTKTIVRSLIKDATKGNLDAVRFLMKHGDFELPSFKINDVDDE